VPFTQRSKTDAASFMPASAATPVTIIFAKERKVSIDFLSVYLF
jgi:hypothetical protein